MKAIITDLDRTLLHTDKSVSEHTIAVFKKCHDHGILIMDASARPIRDILIYNNLIGFEAITATNGAVISLHQKLLEMWGSSRFQSPEEYQLGADIDEITNGYTLGATAFALFGEYNRIREKWLLSDKLFEIATRAVSDDCANRQQTIRQFTVEWEAAL